MFSCLKRPFFLCSRLHSNNLYCDCHLAWLSDWLRQRPRVGLYTQCMGPSHLRGHNVAEVQKREFVCSGKRERTFMLSYYFLLLCKRAVENACFKSFSVLLTNMCNCALITPWKSSVSVILIICSKAFVRDWPLQITRT